MVSRFNNREVGINQTEQYRSLLKKRNLRQIRQYFTADLKFPTSKQIQNLELIKHEWKVGSRFSKLAEEFYGDATSWWIIAHFNQKPTEAHCFVGDVIYIPLPLDTILRILDT